MEEFQENSVPEEEPDFNVEGAAGAEFEVMNEHEAEWLKNNLDKYLEEYQFENVSDLQDLDRLLGLELVAYRWGNWLVRDYDYDGKVFEEKQIRASKNQVDKEIRQVKSSMGMTRFKRIEGEAQSISDYLSNLLRRAKEFGVHRDHQIAESINLFNQLKTMVGLHDRSDAEERAELGVTQDEIFAWIRDTAIPEYDAIDNEFLKNQRLWIREVS